MKRKKEIKLPFTKMSGAGNDFIIIEAFSKKNQKDIKAFAKNKFKFVKSACNRFFGIGADGLLFLKKSKKADVAWEFYNSDGSIPEMCGNAARCIVRYCVDNNITKNKVSIETIFGVVDGQMAKGKEPQIILESIQILKYKKRVGKFTGDHIDSGVPHYVLSDKNIFLKSHLYKKAKFLRSHKSFGKSGTNVTFVEKKGINNLNVISFERGVEDFTLCCGTGALAGAFSFFYTNPKQKLVKIQMPGGKVTVQKNQDKLILSGPVQYICKGIINIEVMNAKI